MTNDDQPSPIQIQRTRSNPSTQHPRSHMKRRRTNDNRRKENGTNEPGRRYETATNEERQTQRNGDGRRQTERNDRTLATRRRGKRTPTDVASENDRWRWRRRSRCHRAALLLTLQWPVPSLPLIHSSRFHLSSRALHGVQSSPNDDRNELECTQCHCMGAVNVTGTVVRRVNLAPSGSQLGVAAPGTS